MGMLGALRRAERGALNGCIARRSRRRWPAAGMDPSPDAFGGGAYARRLLRSLSLLGFFCALDRFALALAKYDPAAEGSFDLWHGLATTERILPVAALYFHGGLRCAKKPLPCYSRRPFIRAGATQPAYAAAPYVCSDLEVALRSLIVSRLNLATNARGTRWGYQDLELENYWYLKNLNPSRMPRLAIRVHVCTC